MRFDILFLSAIATLSTGAALADDDVSLRTPVTASLRQRRPDLGASHVGLTGLHSAHAQADIARRLAAGTLTTLPNWTAPFSVNGTQYSYTLIGTDPAQGPAITIIPTIIVPIRLTIPDYIVNGQPLVLDGSQVVPAMLTSPVFRKSDYDSGQGMQFTDAMLHAEFPSAPAGWHLRLSPSVAPVLDVITKPGMADVHVAKSGKYAVTINDDVVDHAIVKYIRANFKPADYVIFVTYDALDGSAFGTHSVLLNKEKTGMEVFAYTSWLEDVGDLFGVYSPNARTLAHETAASVHDPFGTSTTLLWGDWFNHNKCFETSIEVGNAVEDAPAKVQNTPQAVVIDGKERIFTVQSEALLPFFTRQAPSSAIHQAYSWPNEKAITGPSPLYCDKLRSLEK